MTKAHCPVSEPETWLAPELSHSVIEPYWPQKTAPEASTAQASVEKFFPELLITEPLTSLSVVVLPSSAMQ